MTDTASTHPAEGLLAKAQRILTLAEDVRNEQRLAKDADRYSDRLGHLRELAVQLEPLVACQHALAHAGIPFAPSPKASNYAISADQFGEIQKSFREEPESIFDTPVRDARERAQSLSDGLMKRLQQAWAAHIDATVPSLDRDQLDVFATIPAFRQVTRELGQLYDKPKRLRDTLPTSSADVQAPAELATLVNAAWSQLGGGAPPSVLDLLRAAGTPAGAPLGTLTPKVQAWLDSNGVTEALRIRIS